MNAVKCLGPFVIGHSPERGQSRDEPSLPKLSLRSSILGMGYACDVDA